MAKPLVIRADTPNYVKRAYRVVLTEYGVDLRKLPRDEWAEIVTAALDSEPAGDDAMRQAVMVAVQAVIERKYRKRGKTWREDGP